MGKRTKQAHPLLKPQRVGHPKSSHPFKAVPPAMRLFTTLPARMTAIWSNFSGLRMLNARAGRSVSLTNWRTKAVLARTEWFCVSPMKRIALATCIILASGASAYTQCPAPQYRKGIVWEDSKSTVNMYISIRLRDFSPSRLVCLAKSLRERYRDRKSITIYIFSSREAAKHWVSMQQEETRKHAELGAEMHGAYFCDADKHEEYLLIIPDPRKSYIGAPFDTRIDLPISGTPQCRLQMNSRCLLAFRHPNYPSEALKVKASGTVTLTGTITRDGKMTDVRIAEAAANPPEGRASLANSTLENLKAWRFEPAQHKDAVRITYSYKIDASLASKGQVDVDFALPSQIVIRSNPPAN